MLPCQRQKSQSKQTLVSFIRKKTKKIHAMTESSPFLLQYNSGTITANEHFKHLKHLLLLYSSIERSIKRFGSHPVLSIFMINNGILVRRSQEILRDINEMSSIAQPVTHLSPALVMYCRYISNLQYPEQVLAHALVRILGDLYGGQKIIKYLNKVNPQIPTNFYTFPKRSHIMIKQINMHARHISLIKQMEDKRVLSPHLAYQYIAKLNKTFILATLSSFCLLLHLLPASKLTLALPLLFIGLTLATFLSYRSSIELFSTECEEAFTRHQTFLKDLDPNKNSNSNHTNAICSSNTKAQCPFGFTS